MSMSRGSGRGVSHFFIVTISQAGTHQPKVRGIKVVRWEDTSGSTSPLAGQVCETEGRSLRWEEGSERPKSKRDFQPLDV